MNSLRKRMPLSLAIRENPKEIRSSNVLRLNGTLLQVSFDSFNRYTSSRLFSRCSTCLPTSTIFARWMFLRFLSRVSIASSALPLMMLSGVRMSCDMVRMMFLRVSNSSSFLFMILSIFFLSHISCFCWFRIIRKEYTNRKADMIINPRIMKAVRRHDCDISCS